MAIKLKNANGYHGPLVGLEIEAWASLIVTGSDWVEDEASLQTLRRAARHLRQVTGLAFKAIPNEREGREKPWGRIPTSSPSNPIWAVRSDYSLDPCVAPDDLHQEGVEIITPPLEPELANQAARLLVECALEDDSFLPGMAAGVHVNVSVPTLTSNDAPGLAILDPFRGEASDRRLEEFGDPFFDIVFECLVADAMCPDDVPELVRGLLPRTRGSYLTNVLPLLTGMGYVELRHLGSGEFFRNPARATRLASKCIRLLSNLPRARIQTRIRDAILCSDRLRRLGGKPLAVAAAEARRMPADEIDRWGVHGQARQRLLLETFSVVRADAELLGRFPWAASFPHWQLRRPRRRNSIRGTYAIACVDQEELARKMSAI